MAQSKTPRISVLTPSIRPEGLKVVQESLATQTFQDFEWLVELGVPGRPCDLNAAYNRMLRRAQGELVVSLQDFIKAPDDGLQKFWDAYIENPTTFLTAPVGKTLNWNDTEWDWRVHPAAIMNWHSWEIDWGAAPLKALKAIGGFDEHLDSQWSGDNVNVGLRASQAGYNFGNLRENPAVAYDHNKTIPHPFIKTFSPEIQSERLDEIRREEVNITL